jgi:hypothetical protein
MNVILWILYVTGIDLCLPVSCVNLNNELKNCVFKGGLSGSITDKDLSVSNCVFGNFTSSLMSSQYGVIHIEYSEFCYFSCVNSTLGSVKGTPNSGKSVLTIGF